VALSRSVTPSRFLVVLLALAVVGCTSGGDEAPERGPATPIDPAATGAVRGVVTFSGTPPEQTTLRIAGDATCAAAHDGPVLAGDVLVEDGKVENAFVYVKSGLESFVFELPKDAVVIDQRGCLYRPHVLGAQTGQEIRFLNSDATLHNVHTTPKNSRGSNFGMSRAGTERSIRIAEPEIMVSVKCDVHPWMKAFIGVLDHPFFVLSAADGSYSLEGIPAGEYVLAVWHERLGTKETKITIAAGETAEAAFDLGG
jgi:plastocyanin